MSNEVPQAPQGTRKGRAAAKRDRSQVGDAVELVGMLAGVLGVILGLAGSPTGWLLVGGAVLVLVLAQLVHIRWLLATRRD